MFRSPRSAFTKILVTCAAVVASAAPSQAAAILAVDEGPGTGPAIGSQQNQYVGVSWTQSGTWTDVTVSAPLWTTSVAHTLGWAWITQHVGPGVQPGDELDSNDITFPQGQAAWTTLFSGLTLGPGTWYVIVSVAPAASDVGYRAWRNGDGSPLTGSGVTYGSVQLTTSVLSNTAYPPASMFVTNYPSLAISVTGNGPYVPIDPGDDTPAVPEPGSLVLLAAAMGALAARTRSAPH